MKTIPHDDSRPYHDVSDEARDLVLWARERASDRQEEWERTQALAARLADAERVLAGAAEYEGQIAWRNSHYCTANGGGKIQGCGCG